LRCPAWRWPGSPAVRLRWPARRWWFLLRRIRPSSACAIAPDRGPGLGRSDVFGWLLVCTQKRVFFQGRAVAPGSRCSVLGRGLGPAFWLSGGAARHPSPLPRGERGWSGFGPGHLCCLVGLPLTLALSPEGRGDWIGVASGYALTRL